MAATPNFDQLKAVCNSNRLEHCFHFLFMKDAAVNETFVSILEEEYEVVRRRMYKYQQLLQEGRRFSPFYVAAGDGLRCMREAQYKDGLIFNALNVVLDLAREAREEKARHVATMKQHG